MKTRDRIVHAALELFNENGERAMTTNHIAAHLEISPGNLYYHFRNKQEIVREIFALYSKELIERFTPLQGQYESLTLLKHYLDSMFNLMWKYRFFYSNLPEILQRDEELHVEYIASQEKLHVNLINIMQNFVDMELLDVEKDDLETLVTSLHMVYSGWLAYQSAMSLKTEITEQVIYKGMLQMISLVKPRTTPQGYEQLQLLEDGILALHV
ncbi:TetR/AcrR family transcriptional regulator [Vibrio plantisponsor]|uniref:TetR/AcrR family transcriptional regulator n=1 Tax=Vibrio plantisponsor TaxID=664643 RepID=A0ABU4II56_9VIBR|nr:TetR/AcrR family transcriptional regulator [Vibrio plantisponsor]MDW6018237.1 TetR/AcrR family transcriptional regulator [Vibrio plantisponsor]NNM42532.1 TetR/AcrR family transcriptional regulator [Vibrio plantisponsor]PNH84178.1 TetR family transcriptional regulator [Vibrio diazotrophicus]